MFGIFNIKGLLLGLLLACPPAAAWLLGSEKPSPAGPAQPASQISATVSKNQPVKVPVEIVANGCEPQWVYVEVAPPSTIPEPSTASLIAIASLLIFRRTRKNREKSR